MSTQPINNKCDICGRQATAGIVDENIAKGLRYTCEDHYMQVYEKMAFDSKK